MRTARRGSSPCTSSTGGPVPLPRMQRWMRCARQSLAWTSSTSKYWRSPAAWGPAHSWLESDMAWHRTELASHQQGKQPAPREVMCFGRDSLAQLEKSGGDSTYAGADSTDFLTIQLQSCSRVHPVVHLCGAQRAFESMPNSPHYFLGDDLSPPMRATGPLNDQWATQEEQQIRHERDSASRQIFSSGRFLYRW